MKKNCILACICFQIAISTAFAASEMKLTNVKILFNGEFDVLKDSNNCNTSPIMYNDTVYVPIRNIVEKFNGSIIWDEKKQEIEIYRDYVKGIGLHLGGYQVSVNYVDENGEMIIDETLNIESSIEEFSEFEYDISEYTYIIDSSQPMPRVYVDVIDNLNVSIKQAKENEPYALIKVYCGNEDNTLSEYKINFVRGNETFLTELFAEMDCKLLKYQTNFTHY